MENKDVEDILEFIKSKWKLSIEEEDTLDSVLNLFLEGNNTEINKIENLLNDETEDLLRLLNDREVIEYVTENYNFIASDDESGLVDALHDLDYDFSEKISLEDHIEIVEDHGYQVLEVKNSYKDIVSQAMAHQWMELFEEMTMQQRELYINQIRGTYEN